MEPHPPAKASRPTRTHSDTRSGAPPAGRDDGHADDGHAGTRTEHDAAHGLPAPNHHAGHPGFSGPSGFVAAVAFLFGRDRAAHHAIELAGVRPGDRLVDVGCGPGVAVRRARSIGAEVVGVDPAPIMLRVARVRWGSRRGMRWRKGTAESIPVEDGWARVVWSLSTVHHWADVDAALQEVRRVLAPGGRLVVTERRIVGTDAHGTASHGWTAEQAASFAAICRAHGFAGVTVGSHAGPTTILSVVADLPESAGDG